jgi:hypothetical protein
MRVGNAVNHAYWYVIVTPIHWTPPQMEMATLLHRLPSP